VGVEGRAVEIAETLRRFYGDAALGRADARRFDAIAAGQIGRADLYVAVRTILADRDTIFTRSRDGV